MPSRAAGRAIVRKAARAAAPCGARRVQGVRRHRAGSCHAASDGRPAPHSARRYSPQRSRTQEIVTALASEMKNSTLKRSPCSPLMHQDMSASASPGPCTRADFSAQWRVSG